MSAAMNVSEDATTSVLGEIAYGYRLMLYLMTPSETSHKTLEEVPSYLLQVGKFLPMYLMTEIVLLWLQRKRMPRWNDALTSIACLALIFIPIAVLGNFELQMYAWIHENYRLIDLPWDSTFTWICGFLAADLGFYIWHRAAHEINLIWAFHQVHHTPEDFNVFVGTRLPTLNRQIAILFYLPGAFLVPPSVFYTHYQLNYIFQFWIHTDSVPSLGTIEKVINTPSLHRVHHGRNRYCIDKNYGAVLSVWDRLFGTLQEEKPGEKIYYGLVHPINTWDVCYMQLHHLRHMWNMFWKYDKISDKLSVIFKGPGWYPGVPRLGLLTDIPEVPESEELYDKKLPLWANIYCAIHLATCFVLVRAIPAMKIMFPKQFSWVFGIYLLFSVAQMGWLLEHKQFAPKFEIVRSFAYFFLEMFVYDSLTGLAISIPVLRAIHLASIFLWYNKIDMFRQEKKLTHVD